MKYLFLFIFFMTVGCQSEKLLRMPPMNADLQKAISGLYTDEDLGILVDDIGDAQFVLLGSGSHGTSDFQSWRAEISKYLIEHKGFRMVAVDGDWPSVYPVSQYVIGASDTIGSAEHALLETHGHDSWIWGNHQTENFAEWIREFNNREPDNTQFYGLDLFSMWQSIDAVAGYLHPRDPEAASRAVSVLECLKMFGTDEASYAISTLNGKTDCSGSINAMFALLKDSVQRMDLDRSARFNALQNARAVRNAERFYYASARSEINAWNIRERHMMDMLEAILDHHGRDTKVIIWAHNTRVADAGAINLLNEGMTNLGQLIRETFADKGVYSIGFGSYSGTVTAIQSWDEPEDIILLPPAASGSWEEILHRYKPENKVVLMKDLRSNVAFTNTVSHRAIGMIFNGHDQEENYLPAVPAQAYDAFVFLDKTSALQSLERIQRGKDAALKLK